MRNVWEYLPVQICNTPSHRNFRKSLKTFLFRQCFSWTCDNDIVLWTSNCLWLSSLYIYVMLCFMLSPQKPCTLCYIKNVMIIIIIIIIITWNMESKDLSMDKAGENVPANIHTHTYTHTSTHTPWSCVLYCMPVYIIKTVLTFLMR